MRQGGTTKHTVDAIGQCAVKNPMIDPAIPHVASGGLRVAGDAPAQIHDLAETPANKTVASGMEVNR